MVNHLKSSVDEFIESRQLSKTDNILEIGSNDGTVV